MKFYFFVLHWTAQRATVPAQCWRTISKKQSPGWHATKRNFFFTIALECASAPWSAQPLWHMHNLYWGCPHSMSVFPSFFPSSTMLVEVPLHTMAITLGLFSLLLPVQAYIPAVPTNDTAVTFANGTTVTESSRLVIEWYSLE